MISQNSQAIKQNIQPSKVEVTSDDELPFEEEPSVEKETNFAKVKELDDNKAFGFTEADIEKYKAPIDDEDISEDSDAMDNKSDDENYEDENFD